jgi:hypothetical protein
MSYKTPYFLELSMFNYKQTKKLNLRRVVKMGRSLEKNENSVQSYQAETVMLKI